VLNKTFLNGAQKLLPTIAWVSAVSLSAADYMHEVIAYTRCSDRECAVHRSVRGRERSPLLEARCDERVWECCRPVWADRWCSPATDQLGLSAVVLVLPLEDRQEQRCSSRGTRVRHHDRVVDEQSVDDAGGKTCPCNTRDVFAHWQLWVDPHGQIMNDGPWLDDTVVDQVEVRRRAKPEKLCLVAVQLQHTTL